MTIPTILGENMTSPSTALAALMLGLLVSVLSGWNLRRVGAWNHDGAKMVKKVLVAFYLRLILDGLTLYLAYRFFREMIPVILTATGLVIGMVWSVWPLIKRKYQEGGARQ